MEHWKTHSVIGTKASGLSLTTPSWPSQHDQPTTLHTLVNWNIAQNLTDRWGEINNYDAEHKPLGALLEDPSLLDRLCKQMWQEETFIAQKDGKVWVLFEIEFCSKESEEAESDGSEGNYKPHANVVSALLSGMAPLVHQFPGVSFAVPEESEIIHDRPAAWAFVPDGLLSETQRNSLGLALCAL